MKLGVNGRDGMDVVRTENPDLYKEYFPHNALPRWNLKKSLFP